LELKDDVIVHAMNRDWWRRIAEILNLRLSHEIPSGLHGRDPSVLFFTPAAMGVTTGPDAPIFSTRVSVKYRLPHP
jgi:hypothetical protein